MIFIVEANSKKLLKEFVKFPFALYKNHPYWVPPLINDELETFDKTKNPAFTSAEANFYLAYQDNKVVGRIAAIINWNEVNSNDLVLKPQFQYQSTLISTFIACCK